VDKRETTPPLTAIVLASYGRSVLSRRCLVEQLDKCLQAGAITHVHMAHAVVHLLLIMQAKGQSSLCMQAKGQSSLFMQAKGSPHCIQFKGQSSLRMEVKGQSSLCMQAKGQSTLCMQAKGQSSLCIHSKDQSSYMQVKGQSS
jgi:hypothetical protein